MSRKPIDYTSELPFHIFARANNKEWFYIPLDELWDIFCVELTRISISKKFLIHSFVLMSNHYHMIASQNEKFPLGDVMRELQKAVSARVNRRAGRTNHVFGGPYKASLIQTESYYFQVYKYIYQNPVRAGIVKRVEDYIFSSISTDRIPICSPANGIAVHVPKDQIEWLNEGLTAEMTESIRRGLRKTIFKPFVPRTRLKFYVQS